MLHWLTIGKFDNWDAKNALLHGWFNEPHIYGSSTGLQGYIFASAMFADFRKSLYRLQQTLRAWFDWLSFFLLSLECLTVRFISFSFLTRHVGLFFFNSYNFDRKECWPSSSIHRSIASGVCYKDLGHIHYSLVVKVKRSFSTPMATKPLLPPNKNEYCFITICLYQSWWQFYFSECHEMISCGSV